MIHYLLQSSLALFLLIGIYHLLLKRSKLFQFNRIFLLASLLLALVLPALQIELASTSTPMANELREVSTFTQSMLPSFSKELQIGDLKNSSSDSLPSILFTIYSLVAIGFLFRFAINIFHLWKLSQRKGPIVEGMQTVLLKKNSHPFSFFHYLFVQEDQLEETIDNPSILHHEKAHSQQKHSIDILFIEMIQCLFWFNPILLLFKKAIKANHEYLADAYASEKEKDASLYLKNLLEFIELKRSNPLTSGFGYLIIKNRIKMIHYSKPKLMKTTIKVAAGISFAVAILISSAFSLRPIEDQVEIPLVAAADRDSNIPSILPIKKENILKVGSHYGMRINPITKKEKMHTGIDITAPIGTPIVATAAGKVLEASYSEGYGNHIIIKHDTIYETMYAHLKSMQVKKGQKIKQGDVIGIIGTTGRSLSVHLHYEVLKGEEKVNPVDYFNYEIREKE